MARSIPSDACEASKTLSEPISLQRKSMLPYSGYSSKVAKNGKINRTVSTIRL